MSRQAFSKIRAEHESRAFLSLILYCMQAASADKIFEKNSSFHVKYLTTGKVQFFLEEGVDTGSYFHEVLTLFGIFLRS